ncbi:hypothetical protein D3C75_747000 [compost metagenome]
MIGGNRFSAEIIIVIVRIEFHIVGAGRDVHGAEWRYGQGFVVADGVQLIV